MNKNSNNKKYLTLLLILVFGIIIIYFGMIFFKIKKNDSIIKNKEDVLNYLNSNYSDESFKIGNKKEKIVSVTGGFGNDCNYSGYIWSVESEKNGVKFEVFDKIDSFVINSSKCNKGISDNYVENVYSSIKKEYALESGEYNHSFIIDKSNFSNLDELANYIYEIITKYNLNKGYYDFVIQLSDENVNKLVELNQINSKDDLINNYLN